MMVIHTVYDFLEHIDPTFVGVDALTMTGTSPMSAMGIRGAVERLLPDFETEPRKPFKVNGASGFSQGSLRFATKQSSLGKTQWAILMVTGPKANDVLGYWDFDLKATRIDFRVDVVLRQPCRDLAERLYRLGGESGRVITSLVGSTYYPADNRQSTWYGRIYDKSAEYGEDFGSVWRWEIEAKRSAADELAQTLLECHDKSGFIEDTVFGTFFEQWGVPTPKPGTKPTINYVGGHVISPEQKLDWIRRNVAKSVKELKRQGYTAELDELFRV